MDMAKLLSHPYGYAEHIICLKHGPIKISKTAVKHLT